MVEEFRNAVRIAVGLLWSRKIISEKPSTIIAATKFFEDFDSSAAANAPVDIPTGRSATRNIVTIDETKSVMLALK